MIQYIDSLIERGARELAKGASIDIEHGLGIYEHTFIPEFQKNPALVVFLPVWQEAFLNALDNHHVSLRQKMLVFTHLVHDFDANAVAEPLLACLKRSEYNFLLCANNILKDVPDKFEGHPIVEFLQDAM